MRYDDDDDYEVADGNSVRRPLFLIDSFAVDDVDLLRRHQPGFRIMGDADRSKVNDARSLMIRRAESAWARDANPPQFTCPECHGTGKDPDDDSGKTDCDMCGGTGSIRGPNIGSSSQRRDPGKYPDADLRLDRRRSDDAQVTDARRLAYDGYVKRLTQAWKHRPARDANQPDNSSPPEIMRRYLHGAPAPHDDPAGAMRHHLGGEPDENNAEGLMRRRMRGDVGPDAGARERAYAQRKANLENAWRGQSDPRRAGKIEAQREKWHGGR